MENEAALVRVRGGRTADSWIDHVIHALAEAQDGVVARWQLREHGISDEAIELRVATGRLHRLHRGVYAVGHRRISQRGRWLAAVLAAGDRAALSHRAAGALWELRASGATTVDVTVPTWRRDRRGLRLHTATLADDERTVQDGIATTTVARTILDLATTLQRHQLEGVVREAERRGLGDATGLSTLVGRHRGRRGVRAVRGVLATANLGAGMTRSELEDRFLTWLDDHGLPRPLLNQTVANVECDCVWPAARLVVELDTRTFHATDDAFETDRLRDRALQVAGWTVVRVTPRGLHDERLERDLLALVSRATL